MPFFSIITPTYNRVVLIHRAIQSVLAQDDQDWELIAIDSASTDGTREVLRDYASRDPRIRLVCEETRRGVCPARNLGIEAAVGTWIVPVDSDDELSPGALSLFRRKIAARPEIDQHRFMCRWDDGSSSPRPPLQNETWDYDGYLRFMDRVAEGGNGETQSCIRAETFRSIRYPEDRSYETLYHLDFAKQFATEAHPEVARLYHTDAADQNSFAPNPAHWLRVAPDHARSLDNVIQRHGEAMRIVAPHAYRQTVRSAAKFHFLAGHRREGVAWTLRLWRVQSFSPTSWVVFAFGILGPRALAWADAVRAFLRRP
jgi:glycosyltransferase involved in cell wall biosynthesis